MEENGKSATFINPQPADELAGVIVDGCVAQEGTRADYVVEKERAAVVVELKGRDVEKAAKQVVATAQQWKNDLKRVDEIAGLSVATRFPKASTRIQIQQSEFQKRFLSPLHVVCHNAEYEFDAIFTFKPLKKAK